MCVFHYRKLCLNLKKKTEGEKKEDYFHSCLSCVFLYPFYNFSNSSNVKNMAYFWLLSLLFHIF